MIYVLEDVSFQKACQLSYKMTKGKLFQVLGTVGLMGLVTLLMTSGFILIVALFSTGLISLFPAYPKLINSISTFSVLFVVLIIISFTQILTYEVLLVSYHAEKDDQPIELVEGEKIKKSGKWTLITLAVIFSIVVSVVYSYDVLDPLPNQTVVAVVERSGMSDHVYYQSLDKNIILELKDKYPDATAGYIIGFNLGNLENMNIDFYSLEASAVNKKLVQTLNFWNKGLFVWTVNDTQSMKNYIDLRVSGNITDHPASALEIKEEPYPMSLMEQFWAMLP